MRPALITAVAVVSALLPPTAAPAAEPAILVRDGELRGGVTDIGLLLVEGDVPTWTCREALGAEATFWFLADDGALVAGTAEGVRRSQDGGCSWSDGWGVLGGIGVGGLAATDTAGGHLLVSGHGLGLWRSLDGGATWEELDLPGDGFRPGPLVTDDAGERIVVGASDPDGVPHVLASDDGGVSWSEPFELTGWAQAIPLLLRPDGDGLYLAAVSGIGDDFVVALDVDLTSSPHALTMPPAPAVGAAMVGNDLLYVAQGEGLFRRPPGGEPALVPGGPTACLAGLDGRLWGCGEGDDLLTVSDDGYSWAAQVGWSDVVPRGCLEGTAGAQLCPEIWATLQGDDDDSASTEEPLDDDDSGGSGPVAPTGCECRAAAAPVAEWLALLLVGSALIVSRGSRPRRRRG